MEKTVTASAHTEGWVITTDDDDGPSCDFTLHNEYRIYLHPTREDAVINYKDYMGDDEPDDDIIRKVVVCACKTNAECPWFLEGIQGAIDAKKPEV